MLPEYRELTDKGRFLLRLLTNTMHYDVCHVNGDPEVMQRYSPDLVRL